MFKYDCPPGGTVCPDRQVPVCELSTGRTRRIGLARAGGTREPRARAQAVGSPPSSALPPG